MFTEKEKLRQRVVTTAFDFYSFFFVVVLFSLEFCGSQYWSQNAMNKKSDAYTRDSSNSNNNICNDVDKKRGGK